MVARHLEVLTEEPSMEAFLNTLLPRILSEGSTFTVHPFQGKYNLLSKLRNRLRGYANWIPDNYRIMVVVDRDGDDCLQLKEQLEGAAAHSGLVTRSKSDGSAWQVVNRIAIEELEAWYFGDWEAVRIAYPHLPRNIPDLARYRDLDAIKGGTWESFERVMRSHGYFREGLRKVQAAAAISKCMDPARNRSHSFNVFHNVVIEATA